MNKITLPIAIAVLTSATSMAQDFSNVRSGLLLGVYANASYDGMQVTGTIPGYSAVGRLYPGDTLVRATTDGASIYELKSHWAMENAKSAIGPNRPAAIEIYRPGQGYLYAWIEFSPLSGPTMTYSMQGGRSTAPAAKNKAIFKMESEKSGARQMFSRSRKNSGRTSTPTPKRNTLPPTSLPPRVSPPRPIQGNQSAANLFGRR